MTDESITRVTSLVEQARKGDRQAAADLLPLVYDELRKLAQARMSRQPSGHTLQATALVHEAYLRVIGDAGANWDGRGHFFAAAAQAMRNILVERARRHGRLKHGGDRRRVELVDDAAITLQTSSTDILALDDALQKLQATDERKAQIVQLRYFAGLPIEDIAALLDVSVRTIEREWRFARAWLSREIAGGGGE